MGSIEYKQMDLKHFFGICPIRAGLTVLVLFGELTVAAQTSQPREDLYTGATISSAQVKDTFPTGEYYWGFTGKALYEEKTSRYQLMNILDVRQSTVRSEKFRDERIVDISWSRSGAGIEIKPDYTLHSNCSVPNGGDFIDTLYTHPFGNLQAVSGLVEEGPHPPDTWWNEEILSWVVNARFRNGKYSYCDASEVGNPVSTYGHFDSLEEVKPLYIQVDAQGTSKDYPSGVNYEHACAQMYINTDWRMIKALDIFYGSVYHNYRYEDDVQLPTSKLYTITDSQKVINYEWVSDPNRWLYDYDYVYEKTITESLSGAVMLEPLAREMRQEIVLNNYVGAEEKPYAQSAIYNYPTNVLGGDLIVAKVKYTVTVDTSVLDEGQYFTYNWIERFVSADGSVTNETARSMKCDVSGDTYSEEFEIQPPSASGSKMPVLIDPDFKIDEIVFDDSFLPPDGESTTMAKVGISDLKDEEQHDAYLNRIAWKVVAVKDAKQLGVDVSSQGRKENQSTALVRAGNEVGSVYIVAYDPKNPGVYTKEKIDIQCGACSEGEGTCGAIENECVSLKIGLGKALDGSSSGSLTVLEKTPDIYLYSPVSLQYPVENSQRSDVIRDSYGTLQQVKTASVFADIVVPEDLTITSTNGTSVLENYAGYEIRLYDPTAVQGMSNGLYNVYNGIDPYKVWRIEDPGRLEGGYYRVQISEVFNGDQGSKTNAYKFVWDPGEQGWELEKGISGDDAKQVVKRGSVINGNVRVETRLVTDSAGNDASKTYSYYRTYFFGEALIKEVQDPDGAALVTDYTYYTDESDAVRLGKLESVKYPDASWAKYFYDNEGRRTSVWTPWLDVTLEQATESNCRRTDTSYEPVDPNDIAQDDGWVKLRPRLVTEYIKGTPVSKTAYAYYTNATERIEKVVEYDDPVSGSYADAANEVSTRLYHPENDADPDLGDKLKRVESSDGRVTTYGYTRGNFSHDGSLYTDGTFTFTPDTNETWLCETVTTGVAATPAGIANKTTMSVSYRNNRGGVVLSETWVYTGGASYERINWSANEYDYDLGQLDAVGHVVNRYYSDGTKEEKQWNACCGLENTINRQGQMEHYFYDVLGRRDTVIRDGEGTQPDITVNYTFDAAGRQLATEESGGGLTRTTGSSYDLAGRLLTSTNEAGLVTHYDYAEGGRITTVTQPGGATQITEAYIDGRTMRVSGTGVVEQNYIYSIDPETGHQSTTVYTGPEGSPRWERTITDNNGKTLRTERPGFGGAELATVYYYDATNRLWKTEQQVNGAVSNATINVYDSLGNVTRSGLDEDVDDQLELASMDRITASESGYWYGNPGLPSRSLGEGWWRKSYRVSYPKDDNATPRTNSVSFSRLTGLGEPGTHGILTGESISRDVFGNKTISQSWLDRDAKKVTRITDVPTSVDKHVSIVVNGLLQSSQSASSAGTTRFGYDDLGRRITVDDPRTGTSITHYNDKGLVSWTEDTHEIITSNVYDSASGLVKQRLVVPPSGGSVSTYFDYDLRGNLTKQWGSATYPVAYDYDDYGQKTHMHTYRGGKGWDAAEWPGDSVLADTTEWVYDPATGLLTDKIYADGKGPSYTYWPDGKLWTREWARGITTTYTYWNTGELKTTEYTDDTETISYGYYRNGQQKQIDDAQGIRTFTYTDEGQLDTEILNGTEIMGREYDSFGRSKGYIADATSPARTVTYGYDTYGRFSAITSTVDSVTSVVDYSYIPNSSLLSGYSVGEQGSSVTLQVSKSYESDRNLIVGITNQVVGGSNAGIVSSFTYTNDDLGRRTRREDFRTSLQSQSSVLQNAYWDFAYNSRSELTNAVRHFPDATPVAGQGTSYQYDNIGNRRIVDATSPSRSEIYTANELNQYVARTVPSFVDVMGAATNIATVTVREVGRDGSPQPSVLPAPVIRQGDYFYKAYPVDNLTGAFTNALEINAVINPAGTNDPDIVRTETRSAFVPQTPEQFVYDDDGNLLSDGRFSYSWNGENRLITVSNSTTVAEYAYDYQGRRIQKQVYELITNNWELITETTFLWDGNHIVAEFVDATSPSRTNTYTWGQNDHLVSATLGGTNVFYCHDANKNVTDLVDGSGNAIAHYEFNPYGNINVKTGVLADANPFRFSNEYYDSETEHVAFMLRYLDTVTASWMSRDPIAEKGGVNLYEFCGNNTVNMVDLYGQNSYTAYRALGLSGGDFIWKYLWKMAGHVYLAFHVYGDGVTQEDRKKWCVYLSKKGYSKSGTPAYSTATSEYGEWITFSFHPRSVESHNDDGNLLSTVITDGSFIQRNNYDKDVFPILAGSAVLSPISSDINKEFKLFERAEQSMNVLGRDYAGVFSRSITDFNNGYGFLRNNCGGWAKYIVDHEGLHWPASNRMYNLGTAVDGPMQYPSRAIDAAVRVSYFGVESVVSLSKSAVNQLSKLWPF